MSDCQDPSGIIPIQLGVRFKHPAIVLLYQEGPKYRRRIMPVRGLKTNSAVSVVVSQMRDRHTKYLANLPDFKIQKMLRLIQDYMKGIELEDSLVKLVEEFSIDPDENMNELDDEELKRRKQIMDLSFQKNRKRPGDPNFQYNVEVDFSQVAGMETSAWDSEKDEIES